MELVADTSQRTVGINVCGRLVAKSQLLIRTQPPYFLVSLNGNEDTILVKVNTPQSVIWSSLLDIHSTYRFSNLAYNSITFDDPHEAVSFFNTTESSEYCKLDPISPSSNSWADTNSKLINYEGVITSPMSPLGLVMLDDKLNLCVFFLCLCMNVNELYCGQKIKIFNAHLTSSNMLVMCCRSSYLLDNNSSSSQCKLPLAQIVDSKFGYGDYRWLQKEYDTFEIKFSDDFLLEDLNNSRFSPCNRATCQVMRTNALFKFLNISSNNELDNTNETQLIRDFFSVNHQCILYQQPQYRKPIIKLLKEQFDNFNKFFQDSFNDESQLSGAPYWQWFGHDVSIDSVLIGYLNVSEADGYWYFSDTSLSVPCLSDKRFQNAPNQIVAIYNYKIIVEKFLPLDTNYCEKKKVYLFIQNDAISSLANPNINLNPEHYVPYTKQEIDRYCTLCSIAQRHMQNELMFSECSGQFNMDSLMNFKVNNISYLWKHTHAVVLHYVAAPMTLRNSVYCFLLVTVLQSSSHHAESGAFPCILVLKGKLLKLIPIIDQGAAFYLHFPPKRDVKTFKEAKLNAQLPWSVILLPEETSFSKHTCIHSGSWCTLRELASKNLFNIEGTIELRKELPPKFDSDFVSIQIEGYGEPNLKTIVVVLKDEDTNYTLYLKNWNRRCYPIGLVPGARVCVTLVQHFTSSNSNEYFRATDLTSVQVLSIPDTKRLNSVWGPPCDITLATIEELEDTVCGPVESWTVLSVAITSVCGGCKFLRQNGPCETPGCLSGNDNMTYVVNASICINGMGGKKTVYMKNDNAREMLILTLDDWDILCSLSKKCELKFKKCYDLQERQFHSNAENIFQLYCMDPMLTNRCIFIRCTGFKKHNGTDGNNSSSSVKKQAIFCVELKNKSPW